MLVNLKKENKRKETALLTEIENLESNDSIIDSAVLKIKRRSNLFYKYMTPFNI